MRSPTFFIYKPNSNLASIGRFWKGGDSWVHYDPDQVTLAGLVSLTARHIGLGPMVAVGLCWAISWVTRKKWGGRKGPDRLGHQAFYFSNRFITHKLFEFKLDLNFGRFPTAKNKIAYINTKENMQWHECITDDYLFK
jgi:hypothetical protein